MKKKPMRIIFDAILNGKHQFDSFLHDDISTEYKIGFRKGRKIYSPSKKLKSFQSFITLIVLEYLPVNAEVVFSYRKGTNVVDAIRPHSESKFFYQTDLVDFFSSLNEGIVRRAFLSGVNNCPVSDVSDYTERLLEMIVADNHLPQGFVTSPAMSNACLFDFDKILKEKCKINSLIYSRYSDDLIISGQNREAVSKAEEIVKQALHESGLDSIKINQKKSRFLNLGDKVSILGISILPNGRLTVGQDIKNKVESLLFYYKTNKDKFTNISGGTYEKGMVKLSGYINHINAVDPLYLDKLRKKYGVTLIDIFIHQSGEL